MHKTLYDMLLTAHILFDGEGAGAAAGATGESAPAAGEQSGETMQNAAGSETTAPTPEERTKAWQEMIRGDYKEFYDADMQRVAKNRAAKVKELETKIAPMQEAMDILSYKYGVSDTNEIVKALSNDANLWEAEADRLGLTLDQYMHLQTLERDNARNIRELAEVEEQRQQQARIQGRMQEAQALQTVYPGFNLEAELNNPQFVGLLQHDDIPLQHIYELVHLNDIKQATAQISAAQTEKAVTDNIRAKGARPSEAGTNSHSAFTTTTDISKMSLEEMQALNDRVRNGATIDLVNYF